ncbi:MAG: AMP-binding protein [Spongiibacteraceae bacterium]
MNIESKTPLEMFYHWEANTPETIFLRQPQQLKWREYSWQEVADRVRRTAHFLQQQQFPAGSCIAIYASNSADWVVVDLAIMLSGHISVPLYPGQDAESVSYVLQHSESRLIFLGNFDQSNQAETILPSQLKRVAIQGCTTNCDISLETIQQQFTPLTESPLPKPESIFTILYTSGTTGNPKGVMHAHSTPGHIISRMHKAWGIGKGPERDRMMSYLPLSHAAERCIVEMNALYSNSSMSFSEGLATFSEELRSIKPTFFFSVPRLWVKFKAGIDAKFSTEQQQQFNQADKTKVRDMLGLDKARIVLTGSAPCPSQVHQWFVNMGIPLREGYSMTENFCDGSFWPVDKTPIPGCSGWPLPGVELKLTAANEVCFKSNGLMKGYYKAPDKTAEVLIDGWYHTGDTGHIDEQGLWITGRISEVFKTSKGKFIKPARIEDRFATLPFIQQVCVFGRGLDQPVLAATLSSIGQRMSQQALLSAANEGLQSINEQLPAYEKISTLLLNTTEWTANNGFLTPTMKIKRKVVADKFTPIITASTKPIVIL